MMDYIETTTYCEGPSSSIKYMVLTSSMDHTLYHLYCDDQIMGSAPSFPSAVTIKAPDITINFYQLLTIKM